jgi:signal transduction histidine kinase
VISRSGRRTTALAERAGVHIDEAVAGHGLGLAICADIATVYGGRLEFGTSARLGGLAVQVRLPVG